MQQKHLNKMGVTVSHNVTRYSRSFNNQNNTNTSTETTTIESSAETTTSALAA